MYAGSLFTWTNRQDKEERVWSKLDRVLSNFEFLLNFPHAAVNFISNSISDHSQAIVSLHQVLAKRPKLFKFLNSWCLDYRFLRIVSNVWRTEFRGYKMFVFISKLKLLKAKLKRWHSVNYSFIHSRIYSVEKKLVAISAATQNPNVAPKIFD